MKKLLVGFLVLVGVAFAEVENDEAVQDRVYLGCQAYPSWHSKSCKTNSTFIKVLLANIGNFIAIKDDKWL